MAKGHRKMSLWQDGTRWSQTSVDTGMVLNSEWGCSLPFLDDPSLQLLNASTTPIQRGPPDVVVMFDVMHMPVIEVAVSALATVEQESGGLEPRLQLARALCARLSRWAATGMRSWTPSISSRVVGSRRSIGSALRIDSTEEETDWQLPVDGEGDNFESLEKRRGGAAGSLGMVDAFIARWALGGCLARSAQLSVTVGAGRPKGAALPSDVSIELFAYNHDRKTLFAVSVVSQQWSAPACAALLQLFNLRRQEQTVAFALVAMMRKHRLGDDYTRSSRSESLKYPELGYQLQVLALLSIPSSSTSASSGSTGHIDMSILAPLLTACPQLASFDLSDAFLSDNLRLPEQQWVAVERVIIARRFECLKLQENAVSNAGFQALAHMRDGGAKLRTWNASGFEYLSLVAIGAWPNLSNLTVGLANDTAGCALWLEEELFCHHLGPKLSLSAESLQPNPGELSILIELLNHRPLAALDLGLPTSLCSVQDFISLLRYCGSCLQSLSIRRGGWALDEYVEILAQHSPDLHGLDITYSSDSPRSQMPFPLLDMLTAGCKKLTVAARRFRFLNPELFTLARRSPEFIMSPSSPPRRLLDTLKTTCKRLRVVYPLLTGPVTIAKTCCVREFTQVFAAGAGSLAFTDPSLLLRSSDDAIESPPVWDGEQKGIGYLMGNVSLLNCDTSILEGESTSGDCAGPAAHSENVNGVDGPSSRSASTPPARKLPPSLFFKFFKFLPSYPRQQNMPNRNMPVESKNEVFSREWRPINKAAYQERSIYGLCPSKLRIGKECDQKQDCAFSHDLRLPNKLEMPSARFCPRIAARLECAGCNLWHCKVNVAPCEAFARTGLCLSKQQGRCPYYHFVNEMRAARPMAPLAMADTLRGERAALSLGLSIPHATTSIEERVPRPPKLYRSAPSASADGAAETSPGFSSACADSTTGRMGTDVMRAHELDFARDQMVAGAELMGLATANDEARSKLREWKENRELRRELEAAMAAAAESIDILEKKITRTVDIIQHNATIHDAVIEDCEKLTITSVHIQSELGESQTENDGLRKDLASSRATMAASADSIEIFETTILNTIKIVHENNTIHDAVAAENLRYDLASARMTMAAAADSIDILEKKVMDTADMIHYNASVHDALVDEYSKLTTANSHTQERAQQMQDGERSIEVRVGVHAEDDGRRRRIDRDPREKVGARDHGHLRRVDQDPREEDLVRPKLSTTTTPSTVQFEGKYAELKSTNDHTLTELSECEKENEELRDGNRSCECILLGLPHRHPRLRPAAAPSPGRRSLGTRLRHFLHVAPPIPDSAEASTATVTPRASTTRVPNLADQIVRSGESDGIARAPCIVGQGATVRRAFKNEWPKNEWPKITGRAAGADETVQVAVPAAT
ncbi:hypothetical protein BDK51DRAFT_27778 [Blyttiomyces helicus]|uniref:C3H1-type domain-containing protein n=1 Tax=Blyttiomyces helicus TaxID=388810 RepID=A0A4P9WRM6_9FUNG|nr:hypothetical protein BDK51DRAFT_27778 [Blyttiomyces helicus]|eukprot:RKO94833.1 hypothetical protein BDK51DRAFT_27778 [Blyttiomyces helicus]